MKYKFLKKVDNKVLYNGNFMEIYIPKDYFNWKIAEFEGEFISTIGIFNFINYLDEKEKHSNGELHILKLPMTIRFTYNNFYEDNLSIEKGREPENYYIFELINGDTFVENLAQEQSAENSKKFISLLHGGKLPKVLDYSEIINIYLNSIDLNKVNLNNVSVMYEICIAELCRYKKDINIPFRMIAGKNNNNVSMYDYQNINIKKLPALNSTFNAMTFEDIDQEIISSIKNNKINAKEVTSPIEKIIKY